MEPKKCRENEEKLQSLLQIEKEKNKKTQEMSENPGILP
jgi:hypothetical protein